MKVLQIINRFNRGGGAEKFVLDLTLALHSVNGIVVEVLSIVTPTNKDFISHIEREGIQHSILSSSLKSPHNVIKLRNFIFNGKFDVVHVHLFPSLYIAAAASIYRNHDYKLIYTEHSTTNRRRKNIVLRPLERIIYKRFDNIIAISNKVRENLLNHLNNNSIQVIHNGIDIAAINSASQTNIRREFSIPENAKIVTMVARITLGKDHSTLIKAIEQLPDKFHLVIVGDGPLRLKLEQQISSSSAKKRIHLTGLRNDVFGILKASDVTVLSTEHEGFSISMLEAMACKKPFVASAVPGISDLVTNIAELFPYQDHNVLSNILTNLIESDTIYNRVADRCYSYARCHDIASITKQYLSIYGIVPILS